MAPSSQFPWLLVGAMTARFNLPEGSNAFRYWRLNFHETFGDGATVYKVHVAEVGACLGPGVPLKWTLDQVGTCEFSEFTDVSFFE